MKPCQTKTFHPSAAKRQELIFRASQNHFGYSLGGTKILLLLCSSDRPPSERFKKLHHKWGESN